MIDKEDIDLLDGEEEIKSLRIASAVCLVAGTWSLLFEIFFFREFTIGIYFARVLFTFISLSILISSFKKLNEKTVIFLVHFLILTLIGSFVYTIYMLPKTLYINSQILALLIFTTAIVFSWEFKNQIIVAIYYNLLFAASIILNRDQIFFLPNIFPITIFVCLISLLSVAASAINYNLRKICRNKINEINYVFNSVPISICRVNLKGDIITYNKYFENMFLQNGFSGILNINTLIDDPAMKEYFTNILSVGNETAEFSVSHAGRNKKLKYLKITSKIKHPAGREPFADIIINDETHEKELANKEKEAALKLLNEVKEKEEMARLAIIEKNLKIQLLAKINHDVRTPLSSILLFHQMLEKENIISKEEIADYSKAVKVSVHGLLNTINNFIEYSKIETGNLEVEQELFDLSEEVENIIKLLQPLAAGSENTLVFINNNKTQNIVYTDCNKYRQILINLGANAIKFTRNGCIKIIVDNIQKADEEFLIQTTVADNGAGIHEDKINSLFKPFVSEKCASNTHQSSGLGLAICSEFVKMLNGEINAESKIGEGSKFTFTIPYHYNYSKIKIE